jgi:hypothetical protein
MQHGLWRSLSALVSGTAFAVTVAGPVQWDPCPMHGVHAAVESTASQMPAGHEMHGAATHDHGGTNDSHQAGHQCTCPGGCASGTPVGLRAPVVRAPAPVHIDVSSRIARPADVARLASSPQIALPFAHAPPALRVTPQHAAHSLT